MDKKGKHIKYYLLGILMIISFWFIQYTSLQASQGEEAEEYDVATYKGRRVYFVEDKASVDTYSKSVSNKDTIWNYFANKGFSKAGIAGIMGNLQAESGFAPNNLENAANTKSGYSDSAFTSAVDNGTISRSEFISSSKFSLYKYTDSTGTYYTYGYGLAQWTFYSRKAALYDYWKRYGGSIGNLNMQLDFMYSEMSSSLKNYLKSANNVSDACVYFHNVYEGSADTAAQIAGRVKNAEAIYKEYGGEQNDDPQLKVSGVSIPVKITEGESFAPTGTVSSNYQMTWLWIGVNPYGSYSHVLETECNPMTKTYDISSMTKKLNIASLKPGKYSYQIHVISNGVYKVVCEKEFNVEASDKPVVYLDHSNVAKGEAVKITWSKIEGATKYILDGWHDGKEIVWKDVTNLSSYEVTHDEIGQYGYYIIAVSGSGSSEVKRTSQGATIYVEEPKMTFVGDTFPSSIVQGEKPRLSGTVTANGKITWVWIGVQEGNTWNHVIDTDCNPLKFTYDIESLVSQLEIENLKPGEYTFQIDAISAGQYKTFVRTPFTVEHKHIYDSGIKIKKATCTATGTKKYTCTECGETKTTTIKKLGHNYSTKWTIDKKAKISANGSKSKHCTRCDAKSSVTTIRKASKVKLSTASYIYNGKTKNPSVVIKDSKGNKINSSNYTISKPSGRKNVGKYTYKITFKNQYTGTKKLTLTIKPKSTSISSLTKAKKAFTVKWKKQSAKMGKSRITGYQIQYSTSKKFTNSKKKTISGYSKTSKKVTGLKAKKTYYVRVRTYRTVKFNGESVKVYSKWSKAKSVKTK